MELQVTLHLFAGLGALALGVGVLLRDPRRGPNRQFALLCLALAIWALGAAGRRSDFGDAESWRRVMLLGSCASAPLGLHFVLALGRAPAARRRRWVAFAWVPAALLWLGSWTPLAAEEGLWATLAIAILGGTLALALGLLGRQALALDPGPERRAHLLVLAAGVVAVAGGMSDFLPRDGSSFLRVGPIAVLLLLLVLCGVVVRHRFLDVDVFLARAVALFAGAAAAGLFLLGVTRVLGGGYLALFGATLVVLAAAGPAGKLLLSGANSLLSPGAPVAATLSATSRRLARAVTTDEVWSALASGQRSLPGDVHVAVYYRRAEEQRFRRVHLDPAAGDAADGFAADGPLALWLADEALPLARRHLEHAAREASGPRRARAAAALEAFDALRARLIVPLLRGRGLAGWIVAGRGLAERHLTAEVAAAFLAVGHQAASSLERIEAQEIARRREALAAVGELAAGLAHEVRNPLAAIRGASQALGPLATEGQRAEMLEVILEEGARLDRVVGEFLEYARPASPRREAVDLAALARRTLKGVELAGWRMAMELKVSPDAAHASGDPDQLQRAFDNLARNAWEAAGEGGRLAIEIRGLDTGDGTRRVVARFTDDGPGIPSAELARLFRPFHTTKPGGTGLGLALVERIVREHGGEIAVDGGPGTGATFTLTLPAAEGV